MHRIPNRSKNTKGTLFPYSALLLVLSVVLLVPSLSVHAPPTVSTLTVGTQDTNGTTLAGYYTVVEQNGAVVASGFSPVSFSMNDGQIYSVEVQNYGSCYFNNWADDGYSNDPRNLSIQSDTQITAVFHCATQPQQQGHVVITSVNERGVPFPGYYSVLLQNGAVVATGFTQASFQTTSGQSYAIQVDDYRTCTFVRWQDTGSIVRERTFVASGSTQSFTAVYGCGITISAIEVDTTNSNNAPITGYYVSLWQNDVEVQSCFSPCSFLVSSGVTYQVAVSDYGGESFNHWLNTGLTTRFQTVTIPSGTPGIGLTAVYSP